MAKRPFGYDPLTGAHETWEWDDSEGVMVITRTGADVQPVVDQVKQLHNHHHNRHPVLGAHVASVPLEIVYKWLVEKRVNAMDPTHWPEVKKLLNSNEYQYFRPDRRRL